jgi:hypothetical protein
MLVNPSDEKTEHDNDKLYILYVLKALVLVVYQINCLQRFPLISSVLLHIVHIILRLIAICGDIPNSRNLEKNMIEIFFH